MSLLEVSNLEINYHNLPVIQNISFSVEAGKILGIVGESGSGKTTLLKAVLGLLGRGGRVMGGEIFYEGRSMMQMSEKERRFLRGGRMGMIFQNTASSLCPVRKIESQLYEEVLAHKKMDKKEIKIQALELLAKMRIADGERVLNSYPFELSGGMNQRVGIMMAMILHPDLLLADEPTSALDVTVQAEVVREMIRLREELGTAIVMVTHNIALAERMADYIMVLCEGRVVEYGTKEEVLCHPRQEYTKRLLKSVFRVRREK